MTIRQFELFFSNLREVCQKIKTVETSHCPQDYTDRANARMNLDFFDEVKKKYPQTTRGFRMGIEQHFESIRCYLQENGDVIIEFLDYQNREFQKTITYKSDELNSKDFYSDFYSEKFPGLVHFLTRRYKLF